jgi:hypothetical protein
MGSTPLQLEMKARIRRHMFTVIAGVVAGLAIAVLGGVLTTAASAGAPSPWVMVFPALGFLTVPAVGLGSALHNLRCPACNRRVGFQVSAHYSAFGGQASDDCRHCGQKIFADRTQVRSRPMIMILVVVVAALVLAGALGAVLAGSR